jgi:hypothetical protein
MQPESNNPTANNPNFAAKDAKVSSHQFGRADTRNKARDSPTLVSWRSVNFPVHNRPRGNAASHLLQNYRPAAAR